MSSSRSRRGSVGEARGRIEIIDPPAAAPQEPEPMPVPEPVRGYEPLWPRIRPLARALGIFLALSIVLVALETGLRLNLPNAPRPTTVFRPIAEKTQEVFEYIGATLARVMDLVAVLRRAWNFLRRLLPMEEIWRSVEELVCVAWDFASSPFYFAIGWVREMIASASPPVVILMTTVVTLGLLVGARRWYLSRGHASPMVVRVRGWVMGIVEKIRK